MGILGLPQLRYHSPWVQNFISGIGVGASAGIYVALNLLGAGGGRWVSLLNLRATPLIHVL
jgi:hypothetical protein